MKILVITENDNCCGPMAARFLNDFSNKVDAFSAGVCPDRKVKPNIVELMRECFCDLSDYEPRQFVSSMLNEVDHIIIIGETTIGELPNKAVRMAVPQNLLKAESFDELRTLCDYIKNETFVILKSLMKH